MLKKLALAAAALMIAAPAFADHGYRYDRGNHYGHYKHRRHVVVEHHYVRPQPVVQHYYYRPAPAPRPVVVMHRHDPLPALLFGAMLGAAVVHHAVTY